MLSEMKGPVCLCGKCVTFVDLRDKYPFSQCSASLKICTVTHIHTNTRILK